MPLPLHEGRLRDTKVWYVITEASDEGAARDLDVNFATKLANVGIGCPVCVQDVTQTTPPGHKFGEAITHFQGVPDFSPKRVLKARPTVFPPAVAKPGRVGGPRYRPFIHYRGSETVYNAPIVATGNGPFDVVRHSDTADRVLQINPAKKAGPGRYYAASVEPLIIRGFDSGQPILYVSTETSDAATATLERATFVPLLGKAAFTGGDDFAGWRENASSPSSTARRVQDPQPRGSKTGPDHRARGRPLRFYERSHQLSGDRLTAKVPREDLVQPIPGAQVETRGSFAR
ncbi:MAG: hypothetical protein WKF82_00790 [Nocardioidaceae bacterium]